MKFVGIVLAAVVLGLVGCGGGHPNRETTGAMTSTSREVKPTGGAKVEGKLPPGAVGPVDTAEEAAEGPQPPRPARSPRPPDRSPPAISPMPLEPL